MLHDNPLARARSLEQLRPAAAAAVAAPLGGRRRRTGPAAPAEGRSVCVRVVARWRRGRGFLHNERCEHGGTQNSALSVRQGMHNLRGWLCTGLCYDTHRMFYGS